MRQLMKHPKKRFGYAVIAAGLCASVFVTGVYCNKTYDLPPQPAAASVQLYAKMESYTPILVRKGFDFMVEQAKLGAPIRLEDYQKRAEDVLKKMETDKLDILSDPSKSPLVGELSEKMIATMEPVADDEAAIEGFFKDLDKIAVDFIGRADNTKEANTVAFYASLFKSVLLYYKNNPDALEQHEVLMDGYRNSKAGAETFALFGASWFKNFWRKFKCKVKQTVTGMILGGATGGAIAQSFVSSDPYSIATGVIVGGIVGGITGFFSGSCR